MTRRYTLPDPLPGESDADYCRRAAESIPAEELMRAIVRYMDAAMESYESVAFFGAGYLITDVTGHGSGISRAIAERFREPKEEGRAT